MTKRPGTKPKKRVSRAEWFEAALEELASGGVESIRVERLSRKLGVAKSGFYWHFEDRPELLEELLRFWEEEYTGAVPRSTRIREAPGAERLRLVWEMVEQLDLGRYDQAMFEWARQDPRAAEAVRRNVERRLSFVRQAFVEMGFSRTEAESRAALYVTQIMWHRLTFSWFSEAKRRRDRKFTLDLLLGE